MTPSNKLEYIELLCEFRICGNIRSELQMFLSGFWQVVPLDKLKAIGIDETDLAVLLAGMPYVDVEDWKQNSVYSSGLDGGEQDDLIQWFWSIVQVDLDTGQKSRLLQVCAHDWIGSECCTAQCYPWNLFYFANSAAS